MTLALGIALGGADRPEGWRRMLARVEWADRAGLHSVWLPEGHFRPGATPSPLLALAAFAARTRRLRLATTSVLVSIHHPLRVAAEVATVDALSGGRVLLGLGRGFQPGVFQAFGVEASSKRDRFDEALDALLRAWSGEPFAMEGEHFASLDERSIRMTLQPVQRPHPPLVVAAFGAKGLRQAARRGLAYLASPLETLQQLEENQALWTRHLRGKPDPRAPRAPVMRSVHVAAGDEEARRVREALAAQQLPVGPRAPAALRRAAEGPLEERVVVGCRDEVVDALARYRERLDMDLLVVRGELPGASAAESDASLERLAGEVLPRLVAG